MINLVYFVLGGIVATVALALLAVSAVGDEFADLDRPAGRDYRNGEDAEL